LNTWTHRWRGDNVQLESAPAGELISKPGAIDTEQEVPTVAESVGATTTDIPNTLPVNPIDNDDPMKSRIRNAASRKKLARFIRWMKRIFRKHVMHILTPEERAEVEEIQRRQALYKQLKAESRVAEKRMINCLTRLGICYIRRKKDSDIKEIKTVRFRRIQMEPNALWFQVNMDNLPFGVSTRMLIDQDTINNLSNSVGHNVQVRWSAEAGVWYIIERASGNMGIPNHVNLPDMWDKIPASRDPLTIPVGLTNNSRRVYQSLDEMVHLLIAGTTGGGKSNFLNMIICTLIWRNRPDRLQMLMVDLKGGLEFNYYEGIPHLIKIPVLAPTGIVYERDDVAPLLDWVIAEGERRMAVLLKAGCKNIGEFNGHKKKNLMTQIVVIIDEWADVKLGKDGKDVERALANAVQRMRAVGIHMIVCTQVPQREVLGTLIKANLPAKFAFNCADLQGSMAILNSGHAMNLQPKGRCIFRFQDEFQIQTPFIAKTLILDVVHGAIQGKFQEFTKGHDVTEDEIRTWAVRENNGWLIATQTYNHFKQRGITQKELVNWLQRWEGEEFLIGSSLYKLVPGDGQRGRRLVVVEESETPTPETPA
jgi:DNA segregation ATPase FtsK/SpoIIIE-like protein